LYFYFQTGHIRWKGTERRSKPKDDIPDWARGYRPRKGEKGDNFAKRLLDEKYGKGNYKKGSASEHSQIKKFGDQYFKEVIFLTDEEFNQLENSSKKYNKALKKAVEKLLEEVKNTPDPPNKIKA
jgi:hypothetical protein